MLKLPFQLPVGWLRAFGYPGSRRYIGLYWEPCGDEACYDDGVSSACGRCDGWLYLDYKRQPEVQQWLEDHDIHLGDSQRSAQHWLLADAENGDLFVAPRREAQAFVKSQRLPPSR